jgi:hypothetical protein
VVKKCRPGPILSRLLVLASCASLGCGTFAGVGWGSAIPHYETVPDSAQDSLPPEASLRLSTESGVTEGSLVRMNPRLCLREKDDRVHCFDQTSIHTVERRDSYWLQGLLIGMGADVVVAAVIVGAVLASCHPQSPVPTFAP